MAKITSWDIEKGFVKFYDENHNEIDEVDLDSVIEVFIDKLEGRLKEVV